MVNPREIRLRSIASLLDLDRHSDEIERIEKYVAQMDVPNEGLGSIDKALERYRGKYTEESRRIIVWRAIGEACSTAEELDQRLIEATSGGQEY